MEAGLAHDDLEFGRTGGIIEGESNGICGLKWFFLLSFVAAIICSVLWISMVTFLMATARFKGMSVRGLLALLAPLVFFLWGAREMFRAYKGRGID